MFVSDELLSVWRPEEKEEKKSPLEKRVRKKKKYPTMLYSNGKNHKRRFK